MLLGGRLLRLGAGSCFRRAALLTCGRFRRRSVLLGSGLGRGTLLRLLPGSAFGRGPLLRLLPGSALGRGTLLRLLPGSALGRGTLLRALAAGQRLRGPLLRLLTENFLLLSALLHELLLRTRSAGGMRGRRSRVRRGCGLAG